MAGGDHWLVPWVAQPLLQHFSRVESVVLLRHELLTVLIQRRRDRFIIQQILSKIDWYFSITLLNRTVEVACSFHLILVEAKYFPLRLAIWWVLHQALVLLSRVAHELVVRVGVSHNAGLVWRHGVSYLSKSFQSTVKFAAYSWRRCQVSASNRLSSNTHNFIFGNYTGLLDLAALFLPLDRSIRWSLRRIWILRLKGILPQLKLLSLNRIPAGLLAP